MHSLCEASSKILYPKTLHVVLKLFPKTPTPTTLSPGPVKEPFKTLKLGIDLGLFYISRIFLYRAHVILGTVEIDT